MMNEYDEQVLEKIRDFFAPSGAAGGLFDVHVRVKKFADRFSRITGEKLRDLYATCVCESKEKGFTLQDLWLFSERYIMLVADFDKAVTECESFRLFSAKKRITFLRVTVENYEFDGDLRSFSEGSRLRLKFTTADNMEIEREARGAYCPRLARVIKQWILPNLA